MLPSVVLYRNYVEQFHTFNKNNQPNIKDNFMKLNCYPEPSFLFFDFPSLPLRPANSCQTNPWAQYSRAQSPAAL